MVIRHRSNRERVTPLFINKKNSITPSEAASAGDLTGVVWVEVWQLWCSLQGGYSILCYESKD